MTGMSSEQTDFATVLSTLQENLTSAMPKVSFMLWQPSVVP